MPTSLESLIAGIRDKDDKVRTQARVNAPSVGAPAIGALAAVLLDADMEVARAARRALEKIVHHAGRPGADGEARAVEKELIALLATPDPSVRRLSLWLLSEIGGDVSVDAIAGLLSDLHLREDARCVLQRIGGDKSLKALRDALATAPEDFKFALAESLRKRDDTVAGYPSRKLTPTRTDEPGAVLPGDKK